MGMVAMGWSLDWVIFEVFSNLYDSKQAVDLEKLIVLAQC